MSDTQVMELAVNLDDVSPQVVGDALGRLLEAGALDVWTMPIAMKKQRPGVMLCVLCDAAGTREMAKRMIELTGSLGVRFRPWDRLTLDRRHETVDTPFGPVRMKIGSLDGKDLTARAEFEDARALADRADKPVRDVIAAAEAAWLARAGGATR